MNKFTLLAMAAAVATSGAAFAQRGPYADPYGDANIARADFEKQASDRFDQFDTNHDGQLSADEIAQAAGSPGGRGLRRADANGDGVVTKDEYMAMQRSRFDMMDADHDGQLTKAERDAFRAQMMQRMQSRGDHGGWGSGDHGGWGGGDHGGSEGGSGQ
jgi:hypothetical protein